MDVDVFYDRQEMKVNRNDRELMIDGLVSVDERTNGWGVVDSRGAYLVEVVRSEANDDL